MAKIYNIFIFLFATLVSPLIFNSCINQEVQNKQESDFTAYSSGKPYTRWWWHAMKFTEADLRNQLIWLRDHGFGGVEISFIYPVNRDPEGERFEWLGEEWQEMVIYAKHCADSLRLGCDFTFGTLWPFGGTFVSDHDRTKIWGDSSFKQPLRLSWTHPDTGNVIDHLNRSAFNRYAEVMGKALAPALAGSQSALFCDSWEVETKYLWTDGFERMFLEKFGYDIMPFMDSIYEPENAGPRYDYMKLVAHLTLNEFFIPFHEKCRELGAISRVQCMGSPTDIIRAYAAMDVPESEAMLYEPNFSKIVASAAALANKPFVSSESFTCLYGWPAEHFHEEQTADLKMVADALFANGVNQHIWHGTPFNPIGVDTIYFYASVHVGIKGSLTAELPAFNEYLTTVSKAMQFDRAYSDIAVYLPLEDSWVDGILPEELQLPWAWGAYELRYEYFSPELAGYHPLWINADFLSRGTIVDKKLLVNDLTFNALYVDVQYLDIETLEVILALAGQGLPVCLKCKPDQAGHLKNELFHHLTNKLKSLPNVSEDFGQLITHKPLLEGENLPEFWCRTDGESAIIFVANPLYKGLKYPLNYGQSHQDSTIAQTVTLNFNGISRQIELRFEPYQSLLLKMDKNGEIEFLDITFVPKIQTQKFR
ncbi:MAG: hypothetical protein K9H16_05980 [Bacteroidales bacterium]|nr:hypothetical protein [Bacteroidales bacterium]